MLTKDVACGLAENWIQAWNAHDLDRIMTHYEDDVELMSPVAVERLGIADGKVKGKADLGAYFRKGLEVYPALRFTLIEVLAAGAGPSSSKSRPGDGIPGITLSGFLAHSASR